MNIDGYMILCSSRQHKHSPPPSEMAVERTLALIKPDCCSRPWIEELLRKARTEVSRHS